MQVFVQLEHGPLAGEPGQLLDQNLEGALLLALRAEVQGAIALIGRDAQQRPDQRRRLVQLLGALSEQRLQLGEPVRGFVMGGEARRPLQLRDDRMERAVGVVGRAEMADRDVRLAASFSRRARSSRDLPMPASPAIRTTWPSPSLAQLQRSSSMASSFSRPISGVRRCPWRASKRPSAEPSPSTGRRRQAPRNP